MSAFVGEYIGTAVMMLFISGAIGSVILKRSKVHGEGWLIIVLGVGIGVTFGVYCTYNISGAHLNPAITIALATAALFPWNEVFSYIVAQILGAMTGTFLAYLTYLGQWKYTEDKITNLAFFATIPEVENKVHNMITEIIATFILVFGILIIVENNVSSELFPILVGLLVMGIGCALGGATGYAINPARDLGPRILHAILPLPHKGKSHWDYVVVPILGPIIGGILGALTFNGFFKWNGFFTLMIILAALSILIISLGYCKTYKIEVKNYEKLKEELHE